MHRGHLAVQRSDVNGDGLTDLTVWFDERVLLEHGDLTPDTRTVILLGALTDRSNGIWGASDVQIVR